MRLTGLMRLMGGRRISPMCRIGPIRCSSQDERLIQEGALCNRPRSRRRPRPRLSVSFGFRYVPANVEGRLDQTTPAPPFEEEDDDEDDYEARIRLAPS